MHKDIFFSERVCVISICFLHITCFFFGSLNVREFYPAVVVCTTVFFRCKYACKTSSHPTSSESQMVYPSSFFRSLLALSFLTLSTYLFIATKSLVKQVELGATGCVIMSIIYASFSPEYTQKIYQINATGILLDLDKCSIS